MNWQETDGLISWLFTGVAEELNSGLLKATTS